MIYNKDNPLMKERTTQLSDYLSAGDVARNSYLPTNTGGTVFSPTQLQALVSRAQAAKLAPLASTNQMIVGQLGSLKDILGTARDVATAKLQAALQRAQQLTSLAQIAYEERYRQATLDLQRKQLEQKQANNAVIDVGGQKYLIDQNTGNIIAKYGGGSGGSGGSGGGFLYGSGNNYGAPQPPTKTPSSYSTSPSLYQIFGVPTPSSNRTGTITPGINYYG